MFLYRNINNCRLFSFFDGKITLPNFDKDRSTTSSFTDLNRPLGEDIINCEFKATSTYIYQNKQNPLSNENRKVYYSTTEEKPTLVTFAGLSTKAPMIKGNNGDGPLTKIKDDSETIVLLEQNSMGDFFTYTIFKKEKVATWYKAYPMINSPFGMLSMGYCY